MTKLVMMKRLIYTVILMLAISTLDFSQSCLPNGITFTSQQEIDDFPSNYPGCSEIEGNVCIGDCTPPFNDSNIGNLDGLAQLNQIDGDIEIRNNPNLSSFHGLHNLNSIGGDFTVKDNSSLESLSELNNLSNINGDLIIYENISLTDLAGLDNLITITGNLVINFNSSLTDLAGLNNITAVNGFISINHNSLLSSFSGLSSLNSVGGHFYINDNDALLNFTGLEALSSIGGYLNIYHNESITSLTGFNNLTTIGDFLQIRYNSSLPNLIGLGSLETVATNLRIYENYAMINLEGLDNLISIGGYLLIASNYDMTSLTGIESLTSIGGYLRIHNHIDLTSLSGIQNIDPSTIVSTDSNHKDLEIIDNQNLSECEVLSICNFLDLPDKTKEIYDNAQGCNSSYEIENACNEVFIPNCTSLIAPQNGDTDINITQDLSWESIGDNADGYKLTVGTTSGGTDIMDNEDVGNVTTYDPGDFPCGNFIYVTIVPYNAAGDATGCTEESFTTEDVVADAGTDTEICSGGSTQLNAIGGTTYSWSPSTGLDDPNIANPVASPDATTIYTVTVSNDGRCPDTDDVIVSVLPSPIPNASATEETYNNANDGTATCAPTGGILPYNYLWSNSETTQSILNLEPNNYTITVTDNNGCTAEETVTVNEFVCPTLTINATQQDAQCNGSCDGSITITGVTNGVAPFTYSWSNNATTATNSGLCAGEYTVTVTDDKNCSVSETYTITEPDELFANASATDETGNDFEDGTATSAPSGGTSPYTYAWSNGETTQTITGLAQGNYTVTVTDAHSCTAEETVTVQEFICPTLTIEATVTNSSCNGVCDGQITIDNMINGVPPFTYLWTNGETTQTITGLCVGDYGVTVTDSKNCSETDGYGTIEPAELFSNASATDETANDANDGTATANPSGGTTPYSYEWSNGETTQTIENLAPGDYTVTVTDDNDCTKEETVTVNEYICPTLSLESSQSDNTCYNGCDGEITITNVINGIAPFTYEWSNGQTTQTATNLCAGDYDVTVTDSKNCSVVSETFTVTEPEELTATATSTGETYNDAEDGTATVNSNGGTPSYSYLWNTGATTQTITDLAPGTYNVTVTDDNGCTVEAETEVEEFICPTLTIFEETENVFCNGDCDGYISIYAIDNGVAPFEYLWSTGDTESSIDNLCPDTYSVTVTDADNCTVTKSYEITEPDELLANATATDETEYEAQDGTAIANPTGGTLPYDYEWSTGATTQSISNLAPGDYIVTVTDYYNCQSIDTVTVNEFICPELTVNATQTNVDCNGACNGEIEITSVANAVEPLYYEWSNGETTALINNLCPGTYTVTITDDKNCEVIQDYTITQPEELLANASATDETANDANDGTAKANPTGGISPYSYAWSNGETTQTISGLAPGSYTVTVTDNNGCTSIESVSVAEFGCQGLAIAINQTNVQCNSECNGILDITGVTNGATPFSYTWSNSKTTAKIDSLCPGSYSVTVVDGNNCNVYGSYTITEPQVLSANATSTDETAKDANDGTAISNPSGGTQDYAYSWSTGDTTQAISGLAPGTYFLTVTDANGCTTLDTVTIIEFTCPALEVNSQTSNISCFGACDGSIAVLGVNNAVSPLLYKWNTGATSASMSDLCAGDYSVTIIDSKNCEVVQNNTLTQPDEILITVDSTRDVRLDPLGYIAISTNNNGNYIFSWSGPGNFTAKTEDLDSLSDFGCYTLTVTDTVTNCSKDSTICLEDKTSTLDFEFGNINVYPNPTKGDFIIDFNNSRLKQAEITIFDLSGKQLLNLEKKTSDKVLNVESEVLNAGLYIIRIKSAKFGTSFRKVILSK